MKFLDNQIPANILVIRISSLGDIILTTPLVRNLKKNFPDSNITFATDGKFAEVYSSNPYISELFRYDKSIGLDKNKMNLKKLMKDRGIGRYDLVIDLHNSMRSCHLSIGLGNQIKRVSKHRIQKLALVHLKKQFANPIPHVVNNYFSTLTKFGLEFDSSGCEFWLPEENSVKVYPPILFESNINSRNKVALAPGAKHFTKKYPAEYFIKLIKYIKLRYDSEIYLLGSKDDIEICKYIRDESKPYVHNYAGMTNLIDAARKLDECRFLVTNDSGLMHLAASRKIPLIAIFGSTVTGFGFSPYQTKHKIVETELNCRPCTHIGRSKCPKKHFKCMKDLDPERVILEIDSLIG